MKNATYIKSFVCVTPRRKAQKVGDIYFLNKLGMYQCDTNRDKDRALTELLNGSFEPHDIVQSGRPLKLDVYLSVA